ncbi:MAG: hypothetical protein ACOYMW_11820 [Candidatus Competibacteraceae bacterium]
MSQQQTIYRLALFGLTASGKTTILTALSLAHRANLPPASVISVNDIHENDPQKKASYLFGWNRLIESRNEFERGDMPQATAVKEDLYYRYKFSDDSGMLLTDLVDYAGELIHPHALTDEITKKIRETLREVDGLILLTPLATENDQADFDEQINLLKTSFDSFHESRKLAKNKRAGIAPVSLIINKWDMLGELHYDDLEKEQAKIEEFLNSRRGLSYNGLYKSLCSTFGEENVRIFPVSALGSCEFKRFEDGRQLYYPKERSPLMSLNLEEPFVWLMRRHQQIVLENYQEDLKEYESGWYQPNFWNLNNLISKHAEIETYFRKGTINHQKVIDLVKRGLKLRRKRFLAAIFGISLIYLFVDFTYDFYEYGRLKRNTESAQKTSVDYQILANWLKSYQDTPLRHLLFKVGFSGQTVKAEWKAMTEKVAELQKQEYEAKADFAWLDIENTVDRQQRLTKLEDFELQFERSQLLAKAKNARAALLIELEAKKWEALTVAKTPEALITQIDAYIEANPNSTHLEAANVLKTKALHQIEDGVWNRALYGDTREKIIEMAKGYLEAYPSGRYVADATKLISGQLNQIEDSIWQLVLNTQAPQERLERAKKYVERYPSGRYLAEAVKVEEDEKHRQESDLWGMVAAANSPVDRIKAAKDYLDKYPAPQGLFSAKAQQTVIDSEAEIAFIEKESEFRSEMRLNRFVQAANLLAETQINLNQTLKPRFDALYHEFNSNVQAAYQARVKQQVDNRSWDLAISYLADFGKLPDGYRGINHTDWMNKMNRFIQISKDKKLYEDFVDDRSIDKAKVYLAISSQPVMRRYVDDYKKYLEQQTGPLDLKFTYRVNWQEVNSKVNFKLTINDKVIDQFGPQPISKGEVTERSFRLRTALRDMLNIEARAYDLDSWTGTKALGKQTGSVSTTQLLNGHTMRLMEQDQKFTNTLFIRIDRSSLPAEPELPVFSESVALN